MIDNKNKYNPFDVEQIRKEIRKTDLQIAVYAIVLAALAILLIVGVVSEIAG